MPDGTSRSRSAATRSTTIWAARPSPISRCCPRSRSPRSTRTRPSTRFATSAAASPRASAPSSTPRKSSPARLRVVFGLGGIGLNVIQGLRLASADMIIGVDLNNARKAWGERFGMTHFVNPAEMGADLVPYLVNLTKRGAMRSAAPTTRSIAPATSRSCVRRSSVATAVGKVDRHRRRRGGRRNRHPAIPARHRQDMDGHGLWRGARANRCAEDRRLVHGRQDRIDPMITHMLPLEDINRGFALMHSGESIRFGRGRTRSCVARASAPANITNTRLRARGHGGPRH